MTDLILENLILPPPEIREIVNKTAIYVSRVGLVFEKELITKHVGNKKFAFLSNESPYYDYYQFKIKEAKDATEKLEKEGEAKDNASVPIVNIEDIPVKKLSQLEILQEEAKKTTEKLIQSIKSEFNQLRIPKPEYIPNEVPLPKFLVPQPKKASAIDIDIIKLSAQFCAKNGVKFLTGLRQREAKNPQFEFLQPEHMYFEYFQLLVEAYLLCINPDMAELDINRWETCKGIAQCKKENEKKEEVDDASAVQWHDFIVVKTIDFSKDEEHLLPAPYKSIEEINRAMKLKEKEANKGKEVLIESTDADMEDTDMAAAGIDVEELITNIPMPDAIVVKKFDYQAIGNKAPERALTVQRCPVCDKEFPSNEIDEHVRVELMNPQWREQRRIAQAKQSITNIAEANEITKNLERIAARTKAESEAAAQIKAKPVVSDLDIIRGGSSVPPPVVTKPLPPLPVIPVAPPMPYGMMPGVMMGMPLPPTMHGIPLPNMMGMPIPPVPSMPFPNMPFPPQLGMSNIPLPPAPIGTAPIPPHRLAGFIPPPPPSSSTSFVSNLVSRTYEAMSEEITTKSDNIVGEKEFSEEYKDPYDIYVLIPNDTDYAQFNFVGQTVTLKNVNASTTFQQLKELLSPFIGNMPANKQKIRLMDGTFPKGEASLASCNLRPGSKVELMAKERGSKKK